MKTPCFMEGRGWGVVFGWFFFLTWVLQIRERGTGHFKQECFWRLGCNFILTGKKVNVETTDCRGGKPFSGDGLFTYFYLHLKFSVYMGV